MAREFIIGIPASSGKGEWRTCSATQIIEKGKPPILNFNREKILPPIKGYSDAHEIVNHQRLYLDVLNETVEIHDADGNLVIVKISGLFEGCSKVYDKWSEEDNEGVS